MHVFYTLIVVNILNMFRFSLSQLALGSQQHACMHSLYKSVLSQPQKPTIDIKWLNQYTFRFSHMITIIRTSTYTDPIVTGCTVLVPALNI